MGKKKKEKRKEKRENMSEVEYIFIIFSCKKLLHKSNFIFQLLQHKLHNTKTYIVFGEETLSTEYEIRNDKYLVLKCGDYYEDLSPKTITLFNVLEKIYPKIKGVFKCDDDILPNVKKINECISLVDTHKIPYLGYSVNIPQDYYYSIFDKNKLNNKQKYERVQFINHKAHFATGPFYYLSIYAIRVLNNVAILKSIVKDPTSFFFEDNMIGYFLNQHQIFPVHYPIYSNHISLFKNSSIQNIDNKIRNLFVKLHGGLGNQLFQVAAAYELSRKHNMHLVLVYRDDYTHDMTHNKCKDEFLSTVFSNYNNISIVHVEFSKTMVYQQPKCFEYHSNIIQKDSDYYLYGYFQHKSYLQEFRSEFIDILLENTVDVSDFPEKYPLLQESYFIHVRRGDYVNLNLYAFDRDTYFQKSIAYILEKEQNENIHFYIVSDDISFCKTYPIFNTIQKTFVEETDTLRTFYLMSKCWKGGIGCNSTFSGWATNLNRNPEKNVIFPKNWINVDYPYEIPFDCTITF